MDFRAMLMKRKKPPKKVVVVSNDISELTTNLIHKQNLKYVVLYKHKLHDDFYLTLIVSTV